MTENFLEVRTKSELENAIQRNVPKILVRGDLAEKINKAQVVKKLSIPTMAILTAAILATPFTGGVSGLAGLAAVATLTGIEVVAIVAVVFLGLSLILKITEGYDRKFSAKCDGVEASMELNSKK